MRTTGVLFVLLAGCGSGAVSHTDTAHGQRPTGQRPTVSAGSSDLAEADLGHSEQRIIDHLRDLSWTRGAPLDEGFFADGQGSTSPLQVAPGTCVVLIAVGTSGIADLDAALYAPSGRSVAVDGEDDAHPTVAACAGAEARELYYRVSAYRGVGKYRVLCFQAPEAELDQLEARLGGQPGISASDEEEDAPSPLDDRIEGAERRGFVSRGDPREVPLEGAMSVRLPLPVEAGTCVSVIAMAHGTLSNLDLVLHDETDAVRSEDRTESRDAAVQACPRDDGDWTVEILSAGGEGDAEVAVLDGQQADLGTESALWWGLRPATGRPRERGRVVASGRLMPGEVQSVNLPLAPGACARLRVVGEPSLGALTLFRADSPATAASEMRLCRTRGRETPSLRVWATGAGAYRLLVSRPD